MTPDLVAPDGAILSVPELGRATYCAAYAGVHRPRPVRFVWHHVLPQVAGGLTEAANLVSVCDSCHYTIHAYLWACARGLKRPRVAAGQAMLALRGYQAAIDAGTVDKIPNEGGGRPS